MRLGLMTVIGAAAKALSGLACCLLALSAAQAQPAPALPPGMSFVALDAAGAWRLHWVSPAGRATVLPTQLEPRQACVAAVSGRAVYAAADGSVRSIDLASGAETVIVRSTPRAGYTQPCLSDDGREVYALEMADGKSIETEIVRLAPNGEPVRIARQTGAQHDPFIFAKRWLVYGHVGCADGCDTLLVEIWLRDLLAGTARQLTLLNALSQSPVTDGRRVVFSSNAGGSFQLWQVGADGSGLRQLTRGAQQALYPALCAGEVHFVRAGPQGAVLARLAADGTVSELAVPGLSSFRSLRCLS
jgi:hypothetical protein